MFNHRGLIRIITGVVFLVLSGTWKDVSSFMLPKGFVSSSYSHGQVARRQDLIQLNFLEKQEYAETKIPEEYRKDIEEAESRTPAARDRENRVTLYITVGVIFLACALSNGVYGKVVTFENPDADGFAEIQETLWFQASKSLPILSNKIGLYIDMAIAGICYFLTENEYVRKFNTQEEIWNEIVRRKEAKANEGNKKKKNISVKKGKKKNRLRALAEVIDVEEIEVKSENDISIEENTTDDEEVSVVSEKDEDKEGSLKSFFDKANDMAAAQALILNKNLEEAGIVEKITDESGLKVIGKDAAKKLKKDE